MAELVRKVIVDVDVGTDDYLALLLLLNADKCGKIKIEAIVCSMGNSSVGNVGNNVVRLLETVKRTDIPVFKGSEKSLIPSTDSIKYFHGSDGLGDLSYETEPNIGIIRKEPAAVGISNLVLNQPNEISLICLGPLTNIALAIRSYTSFVSSIKDCWIMGGNYTARGNVTAAAEWNFYIDPEAAYIVLDAIKKPIYILTWESCLKPKISMKWRFEVFGKKGNPEIQVLNRAETVIYDKRNGDWLPCDAFLVASFLRSDIVTQKSCHFASVELQGALTRGQMVLDHLKTKDENIVIIEDVNAEIFKDMLMEL